jgi:predicted Zn-dependent protease
MKKHYTIFVLCAVLFIACATSPTGRRQLMLVSEESAIAASRQAYTEMLKPYAQKGKIDNDPALKDRVDRITGRLIAQAIKMRPETKDWDWSIKIIDDPETVNAWAMAGGKMALYTGLVKKIKPTDDELAQVLGHEIAHALAKHSAEKMSVAMASSIGVVAVGVAADRKGLALTGAALAAAWQSRSQTAVQQNLKPIRSGSNWRPRLATTPMLRSPSGKRWPKSAAKVLPNFSAHIRLRRTVRKSLPR